MRLIRCLFIFSFLSIFQLLNAQTSVDFTLDNFPANKVALRKAISAMDRGDKYFDRGPNFFEKALTYYLQANDFNPNNSRLNFQIGTVYNAIGEKKSAAYYLETAMKLDARYRIDVLFVLAETYHQDGQWDNAIRVYKEYITTLNADKLSKRKQDMRAIDEEIVEINRLIYQCENGKLLTQDTTSIYVTNLGKKVNSKYPDYAAITDRDETKLIFTSRRSGSSGGNIPSGDVFTYEDVYMSEKDKRGNWSAPRPIAEVNTNNHDASVWLSPDGNKMIIYRPKKNGDLYTSDWNGEKWSKPAPMKMINSKYVESHASISPNGRTIYFISNNKKYGTGSFDIYKVEMDSVTKKWSKPKNLGGNINTELDEACVFIQEDGKTMYFSSKGHNSMGGYDLFKSELVDGSWQKAVNLGYPINSPGDEPYIFFGKEGKKAYIDSDRKGGVGEKDLYVMDVLIDKKIPFTIVVVDGKSGWPVRSTLEVYEVGKEDYMYTPKESIGKYDVELPMQRKYEVKVNAPGYMPFIGTFNTMVEDFSTEEIVDTIFMASLDGKKILTGTLFDALTKKAMVGKLTIIDSKKDSLAVFMTDKNGKYQVVVTPETAYNIKINTDGYDEINETVIIPDDPSVPEYIKDFYLDKLDPNKKYALQNIYFDFDKATLRPESVNELKTLKFLMEKTPTLRIEISAHTDNVGSADYNLGLSSRRAESVVKWLIENGISKDRLISKGYGFEQPVAPNDNPANRQLNRRVEFKILSK